MSITPRLKARTQARTTARSHRSGLTLVAIAILVITIVVGAIGPLLAPFDPAEVNTLDVFAGPSGTHWLGTDDLGRDIASRLLDGARLSLTGPVLVMLICTSLATTLAVAAALRGGWVDATISRVLELIFSFPGLILAVVAAAIFGAGLVAPVLALSVAYIPVLARVIRAAAIRERSLPYIEVLRVQGATGSTIAIRHLLPNLMPMIVVQASTVFGYAMLDLAAISYLGLGTQPPTPDWGVMVAEGQSAILQGHPEQAMIAAAVVVMVVVSVNIVGERLADRFNVTEKM